MAASQPLAGLLSGLRSVLLALSTMEGVAEPRRPEAALLGALAAATLASIPGAPEVSAAVAIASVPLITYALAAARFPRYRLASLGFVTAALLVVSFPLIAVGRFADAAEFLLRVAGSTLSVAAVVALIGWRGLSRGLSRLGSPSWLADSVRMTLVYSALLAGEAKSLLAAREARNMGRQGLIDQWKLMATAVGELLIRASARAYMVELAVKARNLDQPPEWQRARRGSLWVDLIAFLPTLAGCAAGLLLLASH